MKTPRYTEWDGVDKERIDIDETIYRFGIGAFVDGMMQEYDQEEIYDRFDEYEQEWK